MSGVVLGIDGGGSATRVLCADLEGKTLASVVGDGSNPHRNSNAEGNVQQAIRAALVEAQRAPEDVRALVAGLSGLDDPKDLEWARHLTAVPGLKCEPQLLNDAEVAHAGAFLGEPGILLVSGTGAIVWGRNESGAVCRDYDFNHYTASAARHLAYDAVFGLLCTEPSSDDGALLASALKHFAASDLNDLRRRAARNRAGSELEINAQYAAFAPFVSTAAAEGSVIARRVCEECAARMAQGVMLVAGLFKSPQVGVALVGEVACAAPIRRHLESLLERQHSPNLRVHLPELTPEAGAVLLALKQIGVPLDQYKPATTLA